MVHSFMTHFKNAQMRQRWHRLTVSVVLTHASAGDVKVTRMVIFGALLGVLDPVLTIAAAESSTHELMRMPNEAMIQQLAESDGSSGSTQGSWIEQARGILDVRKQKIAPGVSSDHEITLAIYKVRHLVR